MTRWRILAILVFSCPVRAQEALPAFAPVSGLPHSVALRRIPAGDSWDLVVALASSQPCEPAPHPCWWTTRDRLGILLQDRRDPNNLQPIAIQPGPNDDCSARVERFTVRELVIACTGEKWATYDNQKFVYDFAARSVVSHSTYPPFAANRLVRGPGFVMTAGERQLLVEIDPASGAPRIADGPVPDAAPESAEPFGPGGRFHLVLQKNRYGSEYPVIAGDGKVYPLPQTNEATWARERPDDANAHLHPDPAEMNEQIGPHRVEDGLFWFGKTFYNSEGLTGVGGFGWFDPAAASYHLIAPPEIYAWSVSALLVETDAVWLALYRRGEYGDYPGGLLRWDRKSERVDRWDLQSVALSIARAGDAVAIGTSDGIVVLRGGRAVSYFVDQAADRQFQIAVRN